MKLPAPHQIWRSQRTREGKSVFASSPRDYLAGPLPRFGCACHAFFNLVLRKFGTRIDPGVQDRIESLHRHPVADAFPTICCDKLRLTGIHIASIMLPQPFTHHIVTILDRGFWGKAIRVTTRSRSPLRTKADHDSGVNPITSYDFMPITFSGRSEP